VVCESIIHRLPLSGLASGPVTSISTLWVPPRERRPPDRGMLERLGLSLP
jgi:hypothetical protein